MTKAFQICYRVQSEPKQIINYSDSDFTLDKDDRRSVSDFIFKFAGGPVFQISHKQKSVMTSIAEAELMALVPAIKHAIWLSKFLNKIGRLKFIRANGQIIVINKDNQAAIKMVNNNQITKRLKQVNISYHFIRERFKNQDIKIYYYYIDKMTADRYIKGLIEAKFNSFIKLFNLRVFKKETAFRVKSIISYLPSFLKSVRHTLFLVSNIFKMLQTLFLLSAL